MSKRHDEESKDIVPKKKSRFGVLADYDDGTTEGTSQGEFDKIQTILRPKRGKRPSVTIDKAELQTNDVVRLCQSFVFNNDVKRPGWLKFINFKQPGQLVFTRINCTLEQVLDEKKQLKFSDKFFDRRWTAVNSEIANPTEYWNKMLHVKVAKREQLKALFEKQTDPLKELHSDDILKLALLTTTEEMANLDYPLEGFEEDAIAGVSALVPTKEKYARVTKDSPIYVLDCEMCLTDLNRSELTRVTLIDMEGNTLLDTFVKPFNEIIDYVTCFSGVTEESLKNVSVRLTDVQEAFRRILPPDAILCAHSIENDLKALRMSHPYCIDVGSAYNMVNKKVRTSLRGLTYYYCNERIQSSGVGHCSYEDSWAALRLLKLKLENGISFGSIALGFNYVEWAKKQKFIDCAQLFSVSSAKDFAKDSYRQVTLSEPREISQCLTCKTPLMSQCQIPNCLCISRFAKHCCLCVGKEIQHVQLEEKDLFNFGNALSVLTEVNFTPSIKEHLKKYKKRKVMVARYLKETEDITLMRSNGLHTFDMSDYKTLADIEEHVFDDKIMSHDLCLLEYNAEKLTILEIDRMNQQIMTPTSNNPPTFPTIRADEDARSNRNQAYQPFAQDRAVSRIMQQLCGIQALHAGFEASSMNALSHLSDLAIAHMSEICRLAKLFCENTGRTIPVDKDVELALQYLNVPESELAEEVVKLLESPTQSALQVRHSIPPVAPKILRIGDSNLRPSYIPNFLPPFPDPHTYIQTDVSCEPDVSYAKHREMCANHQKNLDNSLIAFLATRYPTTSLFREFYSRLKQQAEEQLRGMESEEEEKMDVDPPTQNGTNHMADNGRVDTTTGYQQEIDKMFELKPTMHSIVRQRLKSQYEILLPFEDTRPYLSALLPPEALDDLNM